MPSLEQQAAEPSYTGIVPNTLTIFTMERLFKLAGAPIGVADSRTAAVENLPASKRKTPARATAQGHNAPFEANESGRVLCHQQ
jgi:hypothetical protein